ncbi:MAG: GAF domain-containing protein, partial [Legionellales bacterium]|nr:GAF domain-containing protein [Legionellales bacterium]
MIQLNILSHIVQKVNNAISLEDALNTLVTEVLLSLRAEACTVYMIDKRQSQYVLVATKGLNEQMVRHVRFGLSEGLVGYVGQREEPINLEDANQHEKFLYHHGSGEDK